MPTTQKSFKITIQYYDKILSDLWVVLPQAEVCSPANQPSFDCKKRGGGTLRHLTGCRRARLLCSCLEVPLTKKASCLRLTFEAWQLALWAQTPAKVLGLSQLHAAMMNSEAILPRPWETNSQNGEVREAGFKGGPSILPP